MKRNRIISSLAILKVNWDYLKKDYIENFVPFIVCLIDKKNYPLIDLKKIIHDFAYEYGLVIPYFPMITILNRVRERGYIRKHKVNFMPVPGKMLDFNFAEIVDNQLNKYRLVVSEFVNYCTNTHNEKLTNEEADSAFLSFLKEKDLEILFGIQKESLIPGIKSPKTHKYLINDFINHAYESNPETFTFISDIAIGHIMANTILYGVDFSRFETGVKRINFFFDTRFILRLIGAEGKERKDFYDEFITMLRAQGAKLYAFHHTYDEIKSILEDCLYWIEKPQCDLSKAAPSLKFFIQNNYKASDVERLLVNMIKILNKKGIEITETPDPNYFQIYQIDTKKLHKIIV
ncbi:hypothetical protein KA005_43560, partial [bacterium]|nr:hypothetical protein [bacterium]